MIPKQFFMIWVGETIPTWANNAFRAFDLMNFSFEPIFIHITDFIFYKDVKKFIEVKYDEDRLYGTGVSLNRTINNLNRNLNCPKSFIYRKYLQNINDLKIINYKVILSDLLRFQLLHDYGGIYIDCDAVPRKQFDDALLNRKQFFAASYYGGIHVVRDDFFLGSEPGRWIDFSYLRILLGDMCYPINYEKSRNSDRAKIFFQGTFHFDECNENESISPAGYIDHFFKRDWKTS